MHGTPKPSRSGHRYFFELKQRERHYRSESPATVLIAFHGAFAEKYGEKAIRRQSRSVNVDFGVIVDADDNTDYRIVSVDVVPAFAEGDSYEIPDVHTGEWIKTNPEIHAQMATQAHQMFSREWKGLVRMVKYWNNSAGHGERPVKPPFLIEVMALECLYGGWQGRFDYEIQALFSTLADRIFDEWPDPLAWVLRSATAWMSPPSSAPASYSYAPAARQRPPSITPAAAATAKP